MSSYSDLLITQYGDKPNARATIDLLYQQWSQSFSGAASIPEMLNIDDARGKNLDIIGKIVGQDRTLSGAIAREFFAFTNNQRTKGFMHDGTSGSPWYRYGDALGISVRLMDEEMRLLIRARCIRNFSDCSIDDVEKSCELLFGHQGYALDMERACTWSITIYSGTPLTVFAAKTLDIIPRASGIYYEIIEA